VVPHLVADLVLDAAGHGLGEEHDAPVLVLDQLAQPADVSHVDAPPVHLVHRVGLLVELDQQVVHVVRLLLRKKSQNVEKKVSIKINKNDKSELELNN
jgi:hypothetical protein